MSDAFKEDFDLNRKFDSLKI